MLILPVIVQVQGSFIFSGYIKILVEWHLSEAKLTLYRFFICVEHLPFNIWILRYNISLQSFHKVFVISCPVKLFDFFLLDISFVLEGRHRTLLLFPVPWMRSMWAGFSQTQNWNNRLGMVAGKQAACLINKANS